MIYKGIPAVRSNSLNAFYVILYAVFLHFCSKALIMVSVIVCLSYDLANLLLIEYSRHIVSVRIIMG